MAAHKKYFNLPKSKHCGECGNEFPRPASFDDSRWNRMVVCSLSCASQKGNRLKTLRRAANIEQFFSDRVSPIANGCWLWTGTVSVNGYGRFIFQGKHHAAHRYAFVRAHGSIPDGMMILHSCDNRRCVNPKHLTPGTHSDNMADMAAKHRSACGERSYHARITESDVRIIRADPRRYRDIASDFGISHISVGHIKRRLTWRHVA